jgi:hypothetical protein
MFLRHTPVVEFDPSNKEHRAAVRAFMKRKAWADVELRFAYDPAYGSIAQQVQTRLLEWYIFQEENRGKKKALEKD